MNTGPDNLLVKAEENIETTRDEKKVELGTTLVELGKVSDTKGGFFGNKADSGAGFAIH